MIHVEAKLNKLVSGVISPIGVPKVYPITKLDWIGLSNQNTSLAIQLYKTAISKVVETNKAECITHSQYLKILNCYPSQNLRFNKKTKFATWGGIAFIYAGVICYFVSKF